MVLAVDAPPYFVSESATEAGAELGLLARWKLGDGPLGLYLGASYFGIDEFRLQGDIDYPEGWDRSDALWQGSRGELGFGVSLYR